MKMLNSECDPSINVRISRRNYDNVHRLEPTVKDRLYSTCASFRPFPSARVEFVTEPPKDIFANALGFYGNITNAPAFIAFIGRTSDPNMKEKLGYTGEGIVLEVTSLGLGTCWVALTFNMQSAFSILKLESDEELVAVSPVGHTLESWTFQEKIFSVFGANHHRK